MADFLNVNAIYTQYDHFKNGGRQWSIDISCNGLTGTVEVLALRHRFAQDVLAVSRHNRQGSDG